MIWHPQRPDFRTENFKTIFLCSFFSGTWLQALLPILPCQQSALESLLADLLVILVCGCVVWLKPHKIMVKYCTLITINQRPREEDCISVIQVKNLPILRKRTTLRDGTNGFPAKWRLRNKCRNSILMTRHYPDLGTAPDWSFRVWNLPQPIRSTTQIWVVTCQYGISWLISPMSVRGETIGDVVCFLRLELTFTLIKTVLSLFDFLGEVKSLTWVSIPR